MRLRLYLLIGSLLALELLAFYLRFGITTPFIILLVIHPIILAVQLRFSR